jgi:hypothetical protein
MRAECGRYAVWNTRIARNDHVNVIIFAGFVDLFS